MSGKQITLWINASSFFQKVIFLHRLVLSTRALLQNISHLKSAFEKVGTIQKLIGTGF